MSSSRAPKQWSPTKSETVNSFESWKQNLNYILSLDNNFAPFLDANVTWTKKSRIDANRGFIDDPITSLSRRSAIQSDIFRDDVRSNRILLFQRLTAFFEDNLLTMGCGLTHHGSTAIDEDMSPPLENTIILLWLQLIHRDLPRLVKQRYGTELRSCTLASIKPKISQALSSLLDELTKVAS